MKIQFIKSACVVVEYEGVRVLCDPWLTDGIYYGSWFHYPPLAFQPEDFSLVNYLYLSHIHPDHMDPASLARLPKTIPVLIHNYAEKFVLNLLKRLGFEHVHEISHGESFQLAPDFSIEILAADNCDPEMCGRYFQCSVPTPYKQTMQIDSMAVFKGGNTVVVNTNDCPYGLSKTLCDTVLAKHPQIDFLLVGYSGATAYPQCFDNLPNHLKRQESQAHQEMKLQQCVSYLKHFKPRAFMPFAGQYVLGGKLAPLNAFTSPPKTEELPEIFSLLLQQHGLDSQFVLLNSGKFYDIDRQASSSPFDPVNPQERQKYIDNVLTGKKYDYEADPFVDIDLTTKLQDAYVKMCEHQQHYGVENSDWTIYIDAGQEYVYRVPLATGQKVTTVMRNEFVTPFLRIGLDLRLLTRILDRKAHWNNAEIGSHLSFYREPNIYHRSIHLFMSYFHS